MKRYNEIIKELREEKGVSTLYIAELLKTSQSSYEKYEAGLKELSVRELVALCKFYNVSSNYILDLPQNLEYPKK